MLAAELTSVPKRDWRRPLTAVGLGIALAVALSTATGAMAASPTQAQPRATTPQTPPLTRPLPRPDGWCADYRMGHLSPEARIAGPNRRRLMAAQADLAPGFKAGKATDGIRLLADYQAELEKRKPDRVLAATYLAMTSAIPIGPRLVEHVNKLLCVTASPAVATGIAGIAGAEWREMADH